MPQSEIPPRASDQENQLDQTVGRFRREGFCGPTRLLTASQCALIMRYLRSDCVPPMPSWYKSRGSNDRILHGVATRPQLIGLLRSLIGDDIVLWGIDIVERDPGVIHPWHVDIESADPDQCFASAWIGLENTSRESSLRLISRSHLIGATIQQVQSEAGFKRGEAGDKTVLEWARERDPEATLITPDAGIGDALIFDGRLWHGSNNQQSAGRRTALLLQYAASRSPVFMPDLNHIEWPFSLADDPRPPVVVVSGQGERGVNQLVPPPARFRPEASPLVDTIKSVTLPLQEDRINKWRPHYLFDGITDSAEHLTCHVSVLCPGHSPHPPHAHVEEEILIPLKGEAEIITADDAESNAARTTPLEPGALAYYPAFRHHSIRNPGTQPITYLMFKWHGPPAETDAPQAPRVFNFGDFIARRHDEPFHAEPVLEFPTNFLTKLHIHLTDLQPGAGYQPHEDEYDVAILVLAGEIETLGRRVEPHGVIFYPANTPHGMNNPGDTPARYLVFEFHRSESASNPLQIVMTEDCKSHPTERFSA